MGIVDIDAYSYANWSYQLFLTSVWDGLFRAGGSWTAVHASLLSLGYHFFADRQLSPRIISLTFASASVGFMYVYARNAMSAVVRTASVRRWLPIVAACLYMLLPFRLYLSTIPFTETTSIFFLTVLMSILSARKIHYPALVVTLFVAQAVRYEFWYMVPVIWWYILSDTAFDRKKKIIISVFTLSLPGAWIAANWIQTGNPFTFILPKLILASQLIPRTPYFAPTPAIMVWINNLGNCIGFFGILLTIFGGYRLYVQSNNRHKALVFVPVLFLGALILQVFYGTMEWQPLRYLYTVIVSAFPFLCYGAYSVVHLFTKDRLSPRSVTVFAAVLFFLLADIWYIMRYDYTAEHDTYSYQYVLSAIVFLNTSEQTGEIYFIGSGRGETWYPVVRYLSNRETTFIQSEQDAFERVVRLYEEGNAILYSRQQADSSRGLSVNTFRTIYENPVVAVFKKE